MLKIDKEIQLQDNESRVQRVQSLMSDKGIKCKMKRDKVFFTLPLLLIFS